MDDIPKSIKIPSIPEIRSFSSTSDNVDLMCLKFRKKVCVFRSEIESRELVAAWIVSILVFAFPWATGSQSSPTRRMSCSSKRTINKRVKLSRIKNLQNLTEHDRNMSAGVTKLTKVILIELFIRSSPPLHY
ncbi:hypothetical protein HanPSC8_Chr17g0753961 [Helianthus annuus]|nr:hypothetical protein HanPSC8_Chr17g0753961 [Helianthus annuus]